MKSMPWRQTNAALIWRCLSNVCRRCAAIACCGSACRRHRSRSRTIAHFLVGAGTPGPTGPGCKIIDTGHRRARDLAIELPPSPLEAVMAGEVREQVHDRLSELIDASSHDVDLCEHAPFGRADGPRLIGAPRHRPDHRPSWQHGQGASARRRASSETGRAQSACRDRFARTWHRHRRCRFGVPARIAAFDRELSCNGLDARDMRSMACPKAACFRSRAMIWPNVRRCSTVSGAANSTGSTYKRNRSMFWPSRSPPKWRRATGTRTNFLPCCAAPGPIAILPTPIFPAS